HLVAMSLRLLQKAAPALRSRVMLGAWGAGANRGRGKGAKRATPMSLQHFHEQTASVSAVGSTRHSAWSKGASRSSPSLSAEEADATGRTARPSAGPSAWAKGPPSSAVENLWSAAPAADADEDDWQAPAHEAEPLVNEYVDDWGTDTTAGPTEAYSVAESPTRIEASQEAPCDSDGGGEEVQEPQEPQEPVDPTDEDQEAESLGTDVALWLSHLNLADQKQAVLAWCEEMGAASLEEVIESIEDLAQALALKPLQEKRLQNRAAEAFEKVRASEAAEANADAAATGAGPSTAPQGTSYYDGASSSRAGSKETSAVARAQSFYKSCGQEAEDNYLKQRPTEVAVWVPSAKKSQGERKRQKKPASEAAEEKEAEKARREAERRLEEQLREEHERKLKECRDLIADALDRTDSQAFATALAAAKKASCREEEGKEAQEKLNLALRRRTQRRHDALCALQASLEAPKDESFGPAVQKALEEAKAEGVLEHVPGGREAARDAEAALHDWEIAEQQRQESRMALQFALRRGEVGALQVALSEAKAAGLPDDSELMTEAASLVQDPRDAQEESLGFADWRHEAEIQDGDGNLRLVLFSFLALLSTAIFYLHVAQQGQGSKLLSPNQLDKLSNMSIAALGTLDDGSLDRLRRFNLDVFHKFAPVIPFEPLPSDVFLVGVIGSGITMLTQVAHGLRSKGDMSFNDINEVVPWFHAAQLCGQNLDELQPYKPRLFKTHQLYEKLPEDAKFVVLFRDPRQIFLTRYRRFCNSSWTDYARVSRGAISLENFAVGIFGHESSNEVWKFMRSWISCCLGSQKVLFVSFEDLVEQTADEIRRIGTFISPHGRVSDDALGVAKNQSTKKFMQEHISQFDDHFVLKHLKPFEEEVQAFGRLPRIPKIWTESLPQELPRQIEELFEARWKRFLGETGFASYEDLRTQLQGKTSPSRAKSGSEVSDLWIKGLLALIAAVLIAVLVLRDVRLRAVALLRRAFKGTLGNRRSLYVPGDYTMELSELLEKERLIQEELLQKKRLKQEAITKRERALAEEDLQLLEEAIALCRQQGLPFQGAEETLQRWRLQAEERQAAELQLQAALESEDSAVLRKDESVVDTLESVWGLTRDARIPFACRGPKDRLVEMEARAKRREMAQLELCLAQNSRDIPRLRAALELARAAGVNLPEQQVQEAEEVLADLIQQDSLRREALQRLAEAAKLRDLAMLKQALSASDILSEDAEVQKSKALLLELEEEARAEAEAARRRAAAEAIEAAVAQGDWGKIESALSAGLELGLAEEGAPVRAAHAKLESLREARELEEAQAAVEEAEARLLELQKKEHSLVGAKHKKERSAIGKEMMAIRNSEAYISARNFLKSPDQERKRRQEQRRAFWVGRQNLTWSICSSSDTPKQSQPPLCSRPCRSNISIKGLSRVALAKLHFLLFGKPLPP
ncbi:unnamed protein product, partial [Symbiodinium necroappetens]